MRPEKKVLRIKRLGWEGFRWFPPGVFLVSAVVSAFCYIGDFYSSDFFVQQLEQDGLMYDVLHYFLDGGSMFGVVSLCCASFVGVGLYAQDYEENAVYMRVQRMGAGRYAAFRILQVSVGSWLFGCVSKLLVFPIAALLFHIPMLPRAEEYSIFYSISRLLGSGHGVLYVAAWGVLTGLQALFYTLVTFVVSFFVPHRRLLAAVPMLLWYFNQYVLSWAPLPWYLKPSIVFVSIPALGMEGVSEWGLAGGIAAGLAVMAVAVWWLFVLHLRRNGIFGGEQDE